MDAALAGAAISTSTLAPGSLFAAAVPAQSPKPVVVRVNPPVALLLLGNQPPAMPTGISWGVPWAQGTVEPGSRFSLSAQGSNLPVQSWPLAFWPDGSIKWSGFATILPAGFQGPISLSTGAASSSAGTLSVKTDSKSVTVDTGALQCSIPLSGSNIIESMSLGGKNIAGTSQLVCVLQSGPVNNPEDSPRRERYLSEVKHVTVEQQGPVRAVVRIEGMHRGTVSKREWLPFTVRLYFFSGPAHEPHRPLRRPRRWPLV